MAETYQIEMNFSTVGMTFKKSGPEGIMLEICFGKEESWEKTPN